MNLQHSGAEFFMHIEITESRDYRFIGKKGRDLFR